MATPTHQDQAQKGTARIPAEESHSESDFSVLMLARNERDIFHLERIISAACRAPGVNSKGEPIEPRFLIANALARSIATQYYVSHFENAATRLRPDSRRSILEDARLEDHGGRAAAVIQRLAGTAIDCDDAYRLNDVPRLVRHRLDRVRVERTQERKHIRKLSVGRTESERSVDTAMAMIVIKDLLPKFCASLKAPDAIAVNILLRDSCTQRAGHNYSLHTLTAELIAKHQRAFAILAPFIQTTLSADSELRRWNYGYPVPFIAAPWGREYQSNRSSTLVWTYPTFTRKLTTADLTSFHDGLGQTGYSTGRLEMFGPVDAKLITWASPRGLHDFGPVPHLEIVMPLILPSGRLWRFVLKASLESQIIGDTAPVHEHLAPEDARMVRDLENYFLDPKHRQCPSVFGEVNLAGVMASRKVEVLEDPTRAQSIDQLGSAIYSWYRGVGFRLAEAARRTRKTAYSAVEDPHMVDFERFKTVLKERATTALKIFKFPAFVADALRQDLDGYVEKFARPLHELCMRERARIEREPGSAADKLRRSRLFSGPVGGWPLPFDHMILDTMRQHYADMRGSDYWSGGYEGRHYDRTHEFMRILDLPQYLKQRTSRRVIAVVVNDETSANPYSYRITKDPKVTLGKIACENLRRIVKWVDSEVSQSTQRLASETIGPFEYCAIQELQRRAMTLQVPARKAYLQFLKARADARMPTQSERQAARVEERLHKASENVCRVLVRIIGIIQLFDRTMPRKHLIEVVAIRDYEKAKFIYTIDSNCVERTIEEDDSGRRRSHSEGLGGEAMYGGGQYTVALHDRIFMSLRSWLRFNEARKRENPSWYLDHFDDATGHYHIPPHSLPFSANVTFPIFREAGIDTSRCRVEDCVAPGLRFNWGSSA